MPGAILSVLHRAFLHYCTEQSAGRPAQRLWTSFSLATSVLPRPLSLPFPYSSNSTKLYHQPAEVLPIPLRMLSISCRPAGDFPAAGSLRNPCCTPAFPLLCLSSAAQRLLTELELVLQMASPCAKRLFRPHKGRKLSSCLLFRSSKILLRLIAV